MQGDPEKGYNNNAFDGDFKGKHRKGIERITYTWNNINVWTGGNEFEEKSCFGLQTKPASKQILKNVSGMVRPGELLALMGASGAGKTTLLNVLTSRNTSQLKVKGERAVNGIPVSPDTLTAISAYIQQDDLFVGTLTVREHLNFHAKLRMERYITEKARHARVEEVMTELGLMKCANALIGTPMTIKGISGGEKKRLAFASEILTDPPLLFCDEPTSGLDSFMAANVVQTLKQMASKGKTIICTIHQPASEVIALFDRLLLLAEGRVAFLGDSKDAINFFANQGFPCPMNYNPSDFYILTLAIQPGSEVACKEKVNQICDGFKESSFCKTLEEDAKKVTGFEGSSEYLNAELALKKRNPYKAGWFTQYFALVGRAALCEIREPMLMRVKTIQVVIFSLILGLIFFNQDLDEKGVMNLNGGLFLFLTSMTFLNFFSILNVFCQELPIFLREHFNGMYRTDTYFLGRLTSDLPLQILLPLIFTSIYYWMVGFNSDPTRFLIASLITVLVANTAATFGYMISCISNTVEMAMAIGPMFIVPLMIFGGFFLNSDSVPVYFVWIKYMSWFFYGNAALAVNQWDGIDDIDCGNNTLTCPPNGEVILESLSFEKDDFLFYILMLVALMLFYGGLAFIALLSKTYRKK